MHRGKNGIDRHYIWGNLDLLNKDFKSAILNILKELKETIF